MLQNRKKRRYLETVREREKTTEGNKSLQCLKKTPKKDGVSLIHEKG